MSIEEICGNYDIINYTINEDGSIDVDGDVYLDHKYLDRLPLKFNKVTGNFKCYDNELTSLEGSPKEVGENFSCSDNKLTDLKGSPKEIGGNFDCSHNNLTSLEGCPESVGGDFDFAWNEISNIYYIPKYIGKYFYLNGNNLGLLFNNVDMDFLRTFKSCKVIKGNVINLKRYKYVMSEFNKAIYLNDVKEYYKVK